MFRGFWNTLKKPIIGLAPMDGVTDLSCRTITARYGKPDVMFTEFTNSEGLFYAPDRLLRDFEYTEMERPIVAQIYGHQPEDFYRAAHVVCELGFDGIDINMGCPSKQVTQRNCGAKLITVPKLALEIIRSTRQGIEDWVKGQTLEDLKVRPKLHRVVSDMKQRGMRPTGRERKPIPCSVKTRLGYDSVVIEWWIEQLLTESPVAISIHGRTLKQMYKGAADWGAIGRAVRVAQGSGTLILGNGDVSSLEEATQRISETGVDGVLLGRSAIGNPWVFRGNQPSITHRLEVALEHAHHYLGIRRAYHFNSLKKHLRGYLSNFPEASVVRSQAMRTKSAEELMALLEKQLSLEVVDIGDRSKLPVSLAHGKLNPTPDLQPGEE